jgi:hypothetical protein
MTMLKSLKMSKKIKDTKILCLLGDPQRLPESNFKVQIIIRTNIFFINYKNPVKHVAF